MEQADFRTTLDAVRTLDVASLTAMEFLQTGCGLCQSAFACQYRDGEGRRVCDRCVIAARELEARRRAYADKVDAKRDRLEDRADRLEREGNRRVETARQMADAIPLGQPILVDHYSAKRDRNYRARIGANYDKGFGALKKAEHLRERAESVGTGGISIIEDPDAIAKLEAKTESMEGQRDEMKRLNALFRKLLRKHGAASPTREPSEAERAALVETLNTTTPAMRDRALSYFQHSWDRKPFPGYALTNLSARIRSTKQQAVRAERVEELKATESGTLHEGEGWSITADAEESRYVMRLAKRLPAESYKAVKSMGWRWSPTRNAFLQYLNPAGKWKADRTAAAIVDGQLKLA